MLIPKVYSLVQLYDFKLIYLVDLFIQVVAKLLTSRLGEVIEKLVSPN